jgi:hypothetical protein
MSRPIVADLRRRRYRSLGLGLPELEKPRR